MVEGNKHYSKRRSHEDKSLTNEGKPYQPKKTVIGIIERDGNVVLRHVPNATKANMNKFIEKHVPQGSTIYSDEFKGYKSLGKKYQHDTVNHSLSLYVAGDVHTNTIESFWSVLKRGIHGIYHFVSDKHLERYLNEFAGRYNTRHLDNAKRFDQFLKDSESCLSYKALIK